MKILKKAMRVIVPPDGCDWVTREYYDPTGVNIIGWTGRTSNPWRGCRHVEGRKECDFCWSASLTYAQQRNPQKKSLFGLILAVNDPDMDMGHLQPRKLFTSLLVPQSDNNWLAPIEKPSPKAPERGLWFYGDTIDLFHEDICSEREEVILFWLNIMHFARWQVFQVLTKRATLMRHIMERLYIGDDGWLHLVPKGQIVPWADRPLLPNVWFGVTLGMADKKAVMIGELKKVKAIVRFLSMEPLLNHIDIAEDLKDGLIHWVICGGESGSHLTLPENFYRIMNPDWARSLRDQCLAAKVPFFFKQLSGPSMKLDLLPPLDGIHWPWLPRRPLISYAECDPEQLEIGRAFLHEQYHKIVEPWHEAVMQAEAEKQKALDAEKRASGIFPLVIL